MANKFEKIYIGISKLVEGLGGIDNLKSGEHIKLKSDGFMDLNIDVIGADHIAIAHNYIQNGDVMADPDMEIRINHEMKMAEALSFQQDNMGIYQTVYKEVDGKKMYSPQLKKELNSFLVDWLSNLKMQGFYK